jgi:hypothetical protein
MVSSTPLANPLKPVLRISLSTPAITQPTFVLGSLDLLELEEKIQEKLRDFRFW